MNIDILMLGFILLAVTAGMYATVSHLFSRFGLSLVRTDPHTGISGMVAEFMASVILSFCGSAALAFLFVGLLSLLGASVYMP